jgi:hypothetical protein
MAEVVRMCGGITRRNREADDDPHKLEERALLAFEIELIEK